MTTETRKSVGIMTGRSKNMIRRHRAANIAAASGDECIVLLNEFVLVYVADEFLMEDAEERWTCR